MHTAFRVSTRLAPAPRRAVEPRRARAVVALALGLAAALGVAGPVSAATVDLRVEGASATLHSGKIATGPRSLATADSGCVADGGSVPAPNPTTLTAVADWAQASGATALFNFGGAFLCGVAGEIGDGAGGYWLMKINDRTQASPGVYFDGSTPLGDGDKVLWYRDAAWPPSPTLDLLAPEKVGVGQTLAGRVDSHDSENDAVTSGAGAVVSADGASANAAADGTFAMSFSTSGRRLLTATKPGAIRSSVWVEVVDEPVAPAPIAPRKPVNRFARCAKLYGRGSPTHRRCIRIARAKQRAECRRRTAKKRAHCRKLAKRRR